MTDKQNKPVFNTPNPEELKKAAKEDPLHKREGAQESDVVEKSADEEAADLFEQDAAEKLGNRQTTIANLGGH